MNIGNRNPFESTKALYFTDQEIEDFWVDFTDENNSGLKNLIEPSSPTPKFILGGKGSGKTHLMRYFSSPLQKIRRGGNLIKELDKEGYLGIYLSCSGLNADRFQGKGKDDDFWRTIFEHYMELYLSQLLLKTLDNLLANEHELLYGEKEICREIVALFDRPIEFRCSRLADIISFLNERQRSIDFVVNNIAINRSEKEVERLEIISTRGNLIFGIPQILSNIMTPFKNILFIYLIDEFENFTETQQKYINTLVREVKQPCSFRIGSRLYGLKTKNTYCDNEDLKAGSEYEKVLLDEHLRKLEKQYFMFAQKLCLKRLAQNDYIPRNCEINLEKFFMESNTIDILNQKAKGYEGKKRKYVVRLKDSLDKWYRAKGQESISAQKEIDDIVASLMVEGDLISEKLNILTFYSEWAKGEKDLLGCARKIHDNGEKFQKVTGEHFKGDMIAQLLRDFDKKQLYVGLRTLIEMSWGIPRNLLIILKEIYKWATFNGERPFKGEPITIDSQQKGVLEASSWFFEDARIFSGSDRTAIEDSITKLATLFRDIRYSDKPSECSLIAFSIDLSQISSEARRVIDLAEKWSLLVKIREGRKDKNSKQVMSLYQLNRMLAPLWDLPISRRGTINLSSELANSIFDPKFKGQFRAAAKDVVKKMIAPDFGKRIDKNGKDHPLQQTLPGLE